MSTSVTDVTEGTYAGPEQIVADAQAALDAEQSSAPVPGGFGTMEEFQDVEKLLPEGLLLGNPGERPLSIQPVYNDDGTAYFDRSGPPTVGMTDISNIVNSPALTSRWVQRFVDLGVWGYDKELLMNPSGYSPELTGALAQLSVRANVEGDTLEGMYFKLLQQKRSGAPGFGRGGGGGGGAAAPVYNPPDWAELRETVRGALQSQLGREPVGEEVKRMSQELDKWYREDFNVQVGGGRRVNPGARLQELMREEYAGEFEILEDRQAEVINEQQGTQTLNVVQRMIGNR